MRPSRGASGWRPEPAAAKVPEITVMFWVIKLLTTALGEAAADYLAARSIALAAVIGTAGIAVAMWAQLRSRRYTAWAYWSAVLMVAVFGTMAADGLHIVIGMPYAMSTILFAGALAVVFTLWRRGEGTLSIHSIVTSRRETFYWLAVLATFALGTAAGDLTATTLGLGFSASAVLFAVLIALPGLAWWKLGLGPVAAFWTAYVITRPLGASFADWFGKPHSFGGGLGFGDGTVTVIGLVAFLALVAYTAANRRDIQTEPGAAPGPVPLGPAEPAPPGQRRWSTVYASTSYRPPNRP